MDFLRSSRSKCLLPIVMLLVATVLLAACGGGSETLTIYSGRSKSLVQPVLDDFAQETGTSIRVDYASSSAHAITILEEGDNSPADVVFLQDPGSLGVLSGAGMLSKLPDDLLGRVDSKFRSPEGEWVGITGRARTVIYNTSTVDPEADLPDFILDFTDPEWKGRIGWAPRNASFQAFVTGLRVLRGEEEARRWLEGIMANNPRAYPNNTTIVAAAGRGEIDVGFVNHYYLHRFLAEEGQGFGARNYYMGNGDPGAIVLIAGAAILKTTKHREAAERFVEYLLSKGAQEFFATETKEHPLVPGVNPVAGLPSLDELSPPDIDLSAMADLEGTLRLLRDVGVIP